MDAGDSRSVQRFRVAKGDAGHPGRWRAAAGVLAVLAVLSANSIQSACLSPTAETSEIPESARTISLKSGETQRLSFDELKGGETYRLLVALDGSPVGPGERIRVELKWADADGFSKELHAGDPDLYLPYRPSHDGRALLSLTRSSGEKGAPISVRVHWGRMDLMPGDRPAIEAEPNDSWRQANDLVLGRDVYGSADDVDYLDNKEEGKSGLDWFRFEVKGEKPVLVYFQLDLLDRDVSANLRVYTVDPEDATTRALPQGQGPDGDRPRPRARAVLEAHQPDLHPGDVLPRGERQPPRLYPPHAGPARAALRRSRAGGRSRDALHHQRRRRLVRPGPARGEHLCPRRQPPRHRDPMHGLPSLGLLDRVQPGRPSQRLPDPLQVELPVRDRPAVQLTHAALRRRRPVLAAVHRDPAPGPGKAGGNPARFRAAGVSTSRRRPSSDSRRSCGRPGRTAATCPTTRPTA